jgi:adenylate cyclase
MSSATGVVELNQRHLLPVAIRESWPIAGSIAVLSCLLIGLGVDPFQGFDRRWGDFLLRFRFASGLAPNPAGKVFLVGVKTSDLAGAPSTEAEYGVYADIVERLTDLQVSSIGLDVVMVRGSQSDASRIRNAIRNNGHVALAELRTPTMTARSFPFADPEFPSGQIAIAADPDGVYRRYIWGTADATACAPSLALATYAASFRPARSVTCNVRNLVWKELSPDASSLVDRTVPAVGALLNFRSSWQEPWPRGFKYISAQDLSSRHKLWHDAGADPTHVPDGLPARGNIVLIGSVATGAGDLGPTPFGRSEPYLQLHATALSDLLQHESLAEFPVSGGVLLTLVGLFLIGIVGRWVRGIPWMIVWSAAAILVGSAIGFALLIRARTMIPGVTPLAFMVLGVLGESGRRASLASLEKVQLRQTLGRYFSPNVLKDVLQNPEAMQPREAELTVLLTDVRNFTNITEQFGMHRVFDLLNDIFEVETRAVLAVDGSMEHFVGDQFLAYWGAPHDQPDAADRALEAASSIIRSLNVLHAALEPGVRELFGFGLAIHRGKALFGNKGARARLDYGILGDIVNGAARIESLTKFYGVRQIVTREVFDKATNKPLVRFLDRIRVKGKTRPVEMFEVLIAPTNAKLSIAKMYEDAWRVYERGDFDSAAALFEPLSECDSASRVLLERCRDLIAAPPLHWDGSYQFREK